MTSRPRFRAPSSRARTRPTSRGEGHTITWAVGHLVGLAPPDAYDPRLRKWRFADLPIVPQKFELVPNDERAKKQLTAIHRLMRSSDTELIVNACDAGREGELIFAYVYETASVRKPVRRLWLSSMTRAAIRQAFEHLRPGEEMESLEAAARSRSEADWVVGMNATRAASIRLRAAFDGAVSLGRVQTPTLALVARREEEIDAFRPEPYWLVEASFAASEERLYAGRYLGGKRIAEDEAAAVVEACRGRDGQITNLKTDEQRERPQLLYDLTSLQRHANTRFGFSARRTLAAAQRLYEEHKAITYPRTSSRFLTGDLVAEIRPTAELVGRNAAVPARRRYVTGLSKLPLDRVVNDKKVADHHALIPTRAEHDLGRMREDELKIYDLVARRFLAVFHPDAVYERTRIETTVAEHVFRTSGRVLLEPGWKAVYGEDAPAAQAQDEDSGGDQRCPARPGRGSWRRAESSRCARRPAAAALHRRLPARRHGDRRARHRGRGGAGGHEGLGHRHAGHARGDHRAPHRRGLHRARGPRYARDGQGRQVVRLLGAHPAHLPRADGGLGAPARRIETAPTRARLHVGHQQLHERHRRGSSTS